MKKLTLTALLFLLMTVLISCGGGGGGGSSSGAGGKSFVTITVGDSGRTASIKAEKNTLFAQAEIFLKKLIETGEASASLPSGISKITFTVSAPDMATIVKEVTVDGQELISETFSITNGMNRYFLIEAKDISGTVLYRGSTVADLNGITVTLNISMTEMDVAPPAVISTAPTGDEAGISIASPVNVTFSESIDPSTCSNTFFTLSSNEGTIIPCRITCSGALVTFTPSTALAYNTTYTVTITTGIKDLSGNSILNIYTWTFTTGEAPDTTPPSVTAVSPAIDAAGVSVAATVTATFSEAIDGATLSPSGFTLNNGDVNVEGTITYNGTTATFTPSANLAYGTKYTATITTEVKDLSGNRLAENYTWNFTTIPGTWAKTYGLTGEDRANSIQQTADGGYIVAGYTMSSGAGKEDFWVLKLNRNGAIVWQKTYGGSDTDIAASVQQAADGGYVVAGYTKSFGSGNNDLWILKLDKNGTVEWQKTYGGTNNDHLFANSVHQTSDGGYIVAGNTMSSGAVKNDFWILKLDSSGLLQWQKRYGGSNMDISTSVQQIIVQQTLDNGYVVTGYTDSFSGNYDLWILKLDSSGSVQWQKTYGGGNRDIAYSIKQTTDGGYIVAGETSSFGSGGKDFWILRLDIEGGVQWQKTYGGSNADIAVSIQQTSDGGYIVAGNTGSFGAGTIDYWILKLGSSGAVEWQKTYGGSKDDYAVSIQQNNEGQYIVAGLTRSFGAGAGDFWLLKINSNGTISFNSESGAGTADTNADVADTSVTGAATTVDPVNTSVNPSDTNAIIMDTDATVIQQ